MFFYFVLEALFVLKIFTFLSRDFGHNGKTGQKFMTLQPGLQTIAIYIMSNISQSKGNPDNEIWSTNRTLQEKYFSSKTMQKMRHGD